MRKRVVTFTVVGGAFFSACISACAVMCLITKFVSLTLSNKLSNCRMFTLPSRYEGKESDMADIEQWLSGFEGGNINFTKNDSAGIADVVLNHPLKRNALCGTMMVQLRKIVSELEDWPQGKGLILRGEGLMFCSGGDLDFARATAGADGGFKMALYMHNVLSRLKALPIVSIALIHGKGAIGGGAEIASACDWRLMTTDCRGIGFVHSRMGIVPAWAGSYHLASIVGYRQALNLISSGSVIDAEEGLRIGLLDAIVSPGPNGNGLDSAHAWLSQRTQAEPEVIHAAKTTLLNFESKMNMSSILSEERRLFAPLWGGPANKRALSHNIKHVE